MYYQSNEVSKSEFVFWVNQNLPSGQIRSQVRKSLEMKRKSINPGGRKPLPEEERRNHTVGTKVNDIELEILKAKTSSFKMTIYGFLRQALSECRISAKQYEEFVKVVDEFSLSHLMRLCIIRSVVHPRLTPEELAVYKNLNTNLRNYGRNLRGVAIEATKQCEGNTDYVAAVEKELEWLKAAKRKIQEQLML